MLPVCTAANGRQSLNFDEKPERSFEKFVGVRVNFLQVEFWGYLVNWYIKLATF